MAKKDDYGLDNVFKKTEQTEPKPKDQDPIKPRGIGLRESEWKRLTEIAQELGMKPHALALFAVRDFVARYERGEIKTKTSKRLAG